MTHLTERSFLHGCAVFLLGLSLGGCHLIFPYTGEPDAGAPDTSTSDQGPGDAPLPDQAPPDGPKVDRKRPELGPQVDLARPDKQASDLPRPDQKVADLFKPDKKLADLPNLDQKPADLPGKLCASDQDCDDGKHCTQDTCLKGSCEHTLDGKHCLIASSCIPDNQKNTTNSCYSCIVAKNDKAWTPDTGSVCDDGKTCTKNDVCTNGNCKGQTYSCTDSHTCTDDLCDGKGGCTYPVKSGYCLIGSTCVTVNSYAPETCTQCLQNQKTQSVLPCVSTFAGTGLAGHLDGAQLQARFNKPVGIDLSTGGSLWVADSANHRIRVIDSSKVETVAGSGQVSTPYKDGPALTATFEWPLGLRKSPLTGHIFIADSGNVAIRYYSVGLKTVGSVAATLFSALLKSPDGILTANIGSYSQYLLWITDSGSHSVIQLTCQGLSTPSCSSMVYWGKNGAGSTDGGRTAAMFNYPSDMAYQSPYVYLADRGNHRIRRLDTTSDLVTTVAGSSKGFADGAALSAKFNEPCGLDLDSSTSTLYVADSGNHRIRALSLQPSNAQVSTLAGGSTGGLVNGPGSLARFLRPMRLVLNATGKVLYVADTDNHVIRKIELK